MLTYNTMRFGTDTFSLEDKSALLIAKSPFTSSTDWNYIASFDIDAVIPDGADCRIAFYSANSNNYLFTLDYSEELVTMVPIKMWIDEADHEAGNYTIDEATAELILERGNTLDQLRSFADKPVHFRELGILTMIPVIALAATGDAPRIKLGLNAENRVNVLDKEHISVRVSDTPFKLLHVDFNPTVSGSASADISFACKSEPDGDYSDYSDAVDVIDKPVYALKTKVFQHVEGVGFGDSVKCGKVVRYFSDDVNCASFDEFADIYSVTKNHGLLLKYLAVLVKHSVLSADSIKVFARVGPNIYYYKEFVIGVTDGTVQTFTLPSPKFFDPSTLIVFLNGSESLDYSFNALNNTITIRDNSGNPVAANQTVAVYCGYNHKKEEWFELTADPTQTDFSDGRRLTRFAANIDDSNAFVSAIRIRLFRGAPVKKSYTYTATGQEQSYKYPANIDYAHVVGSVDFVWAFDWDSNTLTFSAPQGTSVQVETVQNGSVPKVYSWTASYAV